MSFKLGINTGFAVNRFCEPEDWVPLIGDSLNLRSCQFTADLLNPSLPDSILLKYIKRINEECQRHQVSITSTFTGAFTRVNHLAHPDKEVREYWVSWFKKFIDISRDLGARSMGSHFGIFSHTDDRDKKRREERRTENIEGWHKVGEYAKQKGLEFLTWEPMSISREQGETIVEARKLHQDVNKDSPLPFKMCLDVDHGDLSSSNPRDTDPYEWIKEFALISPMIHLKQSTKNKGGHWPFIEPYNRYGKIQPDKILNCLKENGSQGCELLLELSFREREPFDSTINEALKESVHFWRKYISE